MKKNFPIKFADDLVCYNVIGSKDKENLKQVGYFVIAKDSKDAIDKLNKRIKEDTDPKNPFKLWNSYGWIGFPEEANSQKEIEKLMVITEDHQAECIENLKDLMKKPTEELIGDDDLALWTYLHCSKRQYNMFDPDGAAIEERNYLEDVLSKYKDYKKIPGKLYFLQAEVSF